MPRRFAAQIVVVENQLTNKYLSFNMTIVDAHSIRHSRHTYRTIDCIPPRHRQLICIIEWIPARGQLAHISYVTSQGISRGWHQASPIIAIDRNDLHSPRPF